MKIAIIAQEEPIYFGPYMRQIIESKNDSIVCVCLLGKRSIGAHPTSFFEKLKYAYSMWLLLEPKAFSQSLIIRAYQNILKCFKLIGSKYDNRSIEGCASSFNIPIVKTNDINSLEFLNKLKEYSPDIILNQSEMIIKSDLLNLPNIGIINRHASLLPKFRGRVGSFWSHANTSPEYGVSIHFVDEQIDSGPIIIQKKYELDSSLSYPIILSILFKESVPLTLEAFNLIERKQTSYIPNKIEGTKTYNIPTLEEIKNYRKLLKKRRAAK